MIYDKSGRPLREVLNELVLVKWERLRWQQMGRPANYLRDPGDRSVQYKIEVDKTGAPRCVMRDITHYISNPGANSWLRRAA